MIPPPGLSCSFPVQRKQNRQTWWSFAQACTWKCTREPKPYSLSSGFPSGQQSCFSFLQSFRLFRKNHVKSFLWNTFSVSNH